VSLAIAPRSRWLEVVVFRVLGSESTQYSAQSAGDDDVAPKALLAQFVCQGVVVEGVAVGFLGCAGRRADAQVIRAGRSLLRQVTGVVGVDVLDGDHRRPFLETARWRR
jgi:hypothetical protein